MDGWLTFRNSIREERFWEHRNESLFRPLDLFCMLPALCHVVIIYMRLRLLGKVQARMPLDLFAVIAGVGLASWLAYTRNRWYRKHRSVVVVTLRVYVCVAMTRYLPLLDVPNPSPRGILTKLLLNSTAPLMLRLGLFLQLPIKQHLLTCLLSMLVVMSHGCRRYCAMLPANVGSAVFGRIGDAMDDILAGVTARGWVGPGSFHRDVGSPCCVVVLFVHVVMGCVLSSAVVYCLECRARLVFLAAEGRGRTVNSRRILSETVVMALWAFVVVAMVLWVCMREAAARVGSVPSC